MNRDWKSKLSLGVVHGMLYPVGGDEGPIAESFEALALDPFLDVIEARRSAKPGMHARLRAMAAATGVSIEVAGQPPLLGAKLSLNDPDAAARKAAVEDVKKSIDAAYEMGAQICAVLSGPMPACEDAVKRGMDLLVESCAELAKYAQSKSACPHDLVWLTVEQFDHTVEKRCLIGPSKLAAELGARVREQAPNFGLTIDLSHLPLLGEDSAELVETLRPWLVHVHVGNALMGDETDPAYGDKHPRFGYPGSENNVAELREFLEVLTYAGYFDSEVPTGKPIVTFEVHPIGDETPEQIWAHTKRTWMRAWAGMGSEG